MQAARLVGVNLAGNRLVGGKDVVHASRCRICRGRTDVPRGLMEGGDGGWRGRGFGIPKVGLLVVKVAFDRARRRWRNPFCTCLAVMSAKVGNRPASIVAHHVERDNEKREACTMAMWLAREVLGMRVCVVAGGEGGARSRCQRPVVGAWLPERRRVPLR